MKKRVLIIAIALLCLSFVNAYSAEIFNLSLEKNYSVGDNLAGNFTLKLANTSTNAKIISNLGEVSLRELLKQLGKPLSCEPNNCSSLFTIANEGEITKTIQTTKDKKIIGLAVYGEGVSIKNFNLSISSAFSEKDNIPLSMEIGDIFKWDYDKPSNSFSNPKNTSIGCFNESVTPQEVKIVTSPYCERVFLTSSKSYLLGANISGSGLSDIVLKLKDEYLNDIASCNFSETSAVYSDDSSCRINFTESRPAGKYYVCVSSINENANYNLKKENSGENCGFYNTLASGFSNDYSVYIKTPKYATSEGIISLPENYKESVITSMNYYLQKMYSMNCSAGCVIPLKISGENVAATLSQLRILFESKDGQVVSSKFFEISEENPRMNLYENITLNNLNWRINNTGLITVVIELSDENIKTLLFNQSVNVRKTPIIQSVYPMSPPAGINVTFYVKVDEKNNLSIYEWNFGDGVISTTTQPFVSHAYGNISEYNLTIKFGSGNYSSVKSFNIVAISPEGYLNSTILDKKDKLFQFESEVGALPSLYNNFISSSAKIELLKSQLSDIEILKASAISSDQFLEIAKSLSKIIVPTNVVISEIKTGSLVYDYNLIDPSFVETMIDSNVSDFADYKPAILEWQKKNVDSQIKQEELIISFEDGSVKPLITIYSLDLISKYSDDSYVIIQENKNNLNIPSTLQTTDLQGKATAIKLGQNANLKFSFFVNSSLSPIIFISPKLSLLPVNLKIEACNKNKVCEKNLGENYTNCKGDCFPVLPTTLWIIGVLIFMLIIYTILQVWYKIRYENYLFKQRDSLFNLILFINKSHSQNTSDREIEKILYSRGWSGEQISYAIKKSEGRNTGMFEIIPVEKIISISEKRKADKAQNVPAPSPIGSQQNFSTKQFNRQPNVYRR
jgi:hypothetical protein